jgi:hypothetical protein
MSGPGINVKVIDAARKYKIFDESNFLPPLRNPYIQPIFYIISFTKRIHLLLKVQKAVTKSRKKNQWKCSTGIYKGLGSKLQNEPLPLIEAGVSDLHYIMSR